MDKSSTFELWVSTNAGNSWRQMGSTVTASEKALRHAMFNANIGQSTRIEIRKTDGSANRLNIDDITVITYGTGGEYTPEPTPLPPTPSPKPKPVDYGSNVASRDDNLGLGNPSNAVNDASYWDNFLMVKLLLRFLTKKIKELPTGFRGI